MSHFWLTYGKAGRLIGVVIMEAPTLVQARMNAAVEGIVNAGAPFVEGHELGAKLMASVLPSQIGRKMSGAEAAELIRWLEGRRKSEK
jgi:GMP synthase-like glutamine amidotransferase